MAPIHLLTENVWIPDGIIDLPRFRAWCRSADFPERGRIDWVGGELEVDMSPEEINSHATAKSAIARELGRLVEEPGGGVVFIDRTRFTVPSASVSTEPDVAVVLFGSLDAGRVRLVPTAGGEEEHFVEFEGAADLVVECVSKSSVKKDRVRLRQHYHAAGVSEYWLVDARGPEPRLTLLRHAPDDYVEVAADPDGYTPSPLLSVAVRLTRLPVRSGIVRYRLESRAG